MPAEMDTRRVQGTKRCRFDPLCFVGNLELLAPPDVKDSALCDARCLRSFTKRSRSPRCRCQLVCATIVLSRRAAPQTGCFAAAVRYRSHGFLHIGQPTARTRCRDPALSKMAPVQAVLGVLAEALKRFEKALDHLSLPEIKDFSAICDVIGLSRAAGNAAAQNLGQAAERL